MARRYYSSTAARTTLANSVDGSATTLSVTAVSGWPTQYPYTLVLDQDTVNEELVSVTGRTGTTITVTRGVDGTSATAHDAGAVVAHGVSARDFDEPNAFINGTGTVTETLLDSGAVTETKLGSGAVTSAKIADGTIVNADINASAEIAQSKIADLSTDLSGKVDYATPVNVQSGTTYTFATDDAYRLTSSNNASAVTLTIPPQSSVTWPDNTILRVVNYGAGNVTIAGGSGVTVTNTATTLAQYESAAAIRTGTDAWTLVPFSGGAGDADFSNTATGTYTDSGIDYKYVTFTSSGTLTITKPGYGDVLLLGGAGSGGLNGSGYSGGGGGAAWYGSLYFEETSYSVVVGTQGANPPNLSNGNDGTSSEITGLTAAVPGGGGGTSGRSNGPTGGSFNEDGYGAGSGTSGITSDITGSSVEYGGGGIGGGVAGNPTTSGAGRVIVRVKTN